MTAFNNFVVRIQSGKFLSTAQVMTRWHQFVQNVTVEFRAKLIIEWFQLTPERLA